MAAHQAPLSLGFSRQEYRSGLPFPSPQNLPDPGIELALASGFFTYWAVRDCWITGGKKGMKEEEQRGGWKGGRKTNEGKQHVMMWDVSWDLDRWEGCLDSIKFYWRRGNRRTLILGGQQIVSSPKIPCGIQINQTCSLSPRSFLSSNRISELKWENLIQVTIISITVDIYYCVSAQNYKASGEGCYRQWAFC